MSWSRGNSYPSVRHTSDDQPNVDDPPSGQQPLLVNTSQKPTVSRYGSVDVADTSGASAPGQSRRRSSPEVWRRDSLLNQVPEEESGVEEAVDDPETIEWTLEEQGLYPGSYRRVVAMYTFVSLSSLVLLGFLAYCPQLFWKYKTLPPESHPPYFPSPLPQFLVSIALWSLAYLLRTPLFSMVSLIFDRLSPVLVTLTFNILHVLLYNIFRLSSLPILRIRDAMQHDRPTWHDPAFYKVWWVALGWATIDVAVGIWQSYTQIALYRNVMVPEDRVSQILAQGSAGGSMTNLLSPDAEEALPLSPRAENPKAGSSAPKTLDDAIHAAVDRDLEQLVNLKEREDVEEIYGLPVIKIPVFVSCLQRIDSILLSTGITLTLSASYLHSSLSLSVSNFTNPPSTDRPFLIAFPSIVMLNLFLNLIYTPLILPRIGVHTTAYIGFLLGLGTFFTGLGLWGALA